MTSPVAKPVPTLASAVSSKDLSSALCSEVVMPSPVVAKLVPRLASAASFKDSSFTLSSTSSIAGRAVVAITPAGEGEILPHDKAIAAIFPIFASVNQALGHLQSFTRYFMNGTFESVLLFVKHDPNTCSTRIPEKMTRDEIRIKDGLSRLESLIARIDEVSRSYFMQQLLVLKEDFEETHYLQLQTDVKVACSICEIERLLESLDALEVPGFAQRSAPLGPRLLQELQEIFVAVRSAVINGRIILSHEHSEMLEELRIRALCAEERMNKEGILPRYSSIDIPKFFNNFQLLKIYRSSRLFKDTGEERAVLFKPQLVNHIRENEGLPDRIKAYILNLVARLQDDGVVPKSFIFDAITSALAEMPEYRPGLVDLIQEAILEMEVKYAEEEEDNRAEAAEAIKEYAQKLFTKCSRVILAAELAPEREKVSAKIRGYSPDLQNTIKEMICRLSDRPKDDADFATRNLVTNLKLTALAIEAAADREMENLSEEEIDELTQPLKSRLHPEFIPQATSVSASEGKE